MDIQLYCSLQDSAFCYSEKQQEVKYCLASQDDDLLFSHKIPSTQGNQLLKEHIKGKEGDRFMLS